MTENSSLEAGYARLHALALAGHLAHLQRGDHHGNPALQVAGSVFVSVLDPATALLHCPVDQKVLLMEISPDIYFETEQHVGEDAVLIRLDRISDEELALRLHDAWHFRAPESARSHR